MNFIYIYCSKKKSLMQDLVQQNSWYLFINFRLPLLADRGRIFHSFHPSFRLILNLNFTLGNVSPRFLQQSWETFFLSLRIFSIKNESIHHVLLGTDQVGIYSITSFLPFFLTLGNGRLPCWWWKLSMIMW